MAELQFNPQYLQTPNVHKFGGSSLQDANQINFVISTIKSKVRRGDFVVVSANGKVTDFLQSFINGNEPALDQLRIYLNQLLDSVLHTPDQLLAEINQELSQLIEHSDDTIYNQHAILALGEIWSARLLSNKLREEQIQNNWLDARDFFVLDEQNHLANKAIAKSQFLHLSKLCGSQADLPLFNIVTGFIAQDLAGDTITLGRNGSDYTATIIAELVQSTTVYLWTDVDGVYTADPNVIKDAKSIPKLTISEAQALSELGSNVLHQKTIAPILQQPTQLVINTCSSESAGTVVDRRDLADSEVESFKLKGAVKTLAHKSNLVYLSVARVNELKARQFQAQLTASQINNYANHYDKTQHKLSFYIENNDLFKTTKLIKSAGLKLEKQLSQVSLISAVGQNIRQNHQVITKVLNRSAQFNVHNIHYPANDHTLCVLLPDEQATELLYDLHETFFGLEPSIPIVVLGYGNIGKQFLKILKVNKAKIEKNVKQSLSVVAVANSQYYQFNENCLLDQNIELTEPNSQGELLQQLQIYAGKPVVIIDVTASEWVAEQYLEFAQNGWHLISANKIAAANHDWANDIERALSQNKRQWLKNTTVGAALPVQECIRKVSESGDQIKNVSGVFSGSLSWLFGQYDDTKTFMEWVRQAQKNAYTEPDPREDLSGQDVYRKALIIAKELGFSPSKISFKPVIPESHLSGSLSQFWDNKSVINEYISTLWKQASQSGKQLRYLASVSADELTVELVAVDENHAAAGLQPGDNIFIIESEWYADNPLVIQGPGAGREVTAAGVLNDLIDVLRSG